MSESLAARLIAGDRRALARLATRVENDDAVGRAGLALVYPHSGRAHRIGVTGPPGAGKSTLVNALIGAFRAKGRQVGVIAVDPTSPFSGGATLGDRIRMMDRHADEGVFVRSLASRGHPGGLARATSAVAHLLDAAEFDPILIETVGAGQDEIAIANAAHTTVVVQVPGLGDSIQTIKAGLLEIGDVLVVNKKDQPGAETLVRDLIRSLAFATPTTRSRRPVVLATDAVRGDGIVALVDALDNHRRELQSGPEWDERQQAMAKAELAAALHHDLDRRYTALIDADPRLARLTAELAARLIAPLGATAAALNYLHPPSAD